MKSRNAGSAVLLLLLVCLGVASLVMGLSSALLFGNTGLDQETEGRAAQRQREASLRLLASQAAENWTAQEVELADSVTATLTPVAPDDTCTLRAALTFPWGSGTKEESVWLERAGDGITLPMAAVVASALTMPEGRGDEWLGLAEDERGPAPVYLLSRASALMPATADLRPLDEPWRLDEGTRLLAESVASAATWYLSAACPAPIMDAAASVRSLVFIQERSGVVSLPEDRRGASPDEPVAVVVCGGATLDARDYGDLYGVLIVDDGDLELEGTTLHGAVFVTGSVDLGTTGCISYSSRLLSWAQDESFTRLRLIPGTRRQKLIE